METPTALTAQRLVSRVRAFVKYVVPKGPVPPFYGGDYATRETPRPQVREALPLIHATAIDWTIHRR